MAASMGPPRTVLILSLSKDAGQTRSSYAAIRFFSMRRRISPAASGMLVPGP
jgi:hypothetical protein